MGQGVADQPRGSTPPPWPHVGRDIPLDAAKVATVYAGYEALKARGDGVALLDFDDLLLHTAAAIENDAAVAEEFRDRYRCFVVDEYQDVTPLQQRVLDGLAGRARRPDRRRRRQPDHLLVHRGHAAATCSTSRGASPTPPWCGWSATTGPPRRWCRWPTR